MKIKNLIEDKKRLKKILEKFEKLKIIRKGDFHKAEIQGHLEKSKNNLKFAKDVLNLEYFDWGITGCYYALYHSALALIMKKGYFSKNHNATLYLLIEKYSDKFEKEDISLMKNLFLNYQDLLFYSQIKKKRTSSTYNSRYISTKKETDELRKDTIKLVNKMIRIFKEQKW